MTTKPKLCIIRMSHKTQLTNERQIKVNIMATDKKFSVVGTSTLNGKTKVRFANDSLRVKILAKNGHENINLINLPSEMYKWQIAEHLNSIDFAKGDAAVQGAIDYIAKKNPAPASQDAPVNEEVTVEQPVVA